MINGCSYELFSKNWALLLEKVHCNNGEVLFYLSCDNGACDVCENINVRFPSSARENILAEIGEIDGMKEDGL